MSNEISQEAKTSIAQLNQWKARERLDRDGANSSDALRRRVRAFAEERSLPPADIAKLMYKRINTRDVMLFCEKHKVLRLAAVRRPSRAAKDDPGGEGSRGAGNARSAAQGGHAAVFRTLPADADRRARKAAQAVTQT